MITELCAAFGLEQRSVRNVMTGAGVGQDATLSSIFGSAHRTRSGEDVTEDSSCTLSAVYAAVRLLAWTQAHLPLPIYERMPDGNREERKDHEVYRLLNSRPNDEQNAFVFRVQLVADELLWGNSYAWIERNRAGRVMALWPLPASEVRVERVAGAITYDLSRVKDSPAGNTILGPVDVLHIPNVVGLGRAQVLPGRVGKGVIAYAREQFGEALASQHYSGGWFGNGAVPATVIKHPGRLSPEAATRIRSDWERIHAGSDNAGKTAVLWEGMDVDTLSMPLKDMQFLELRQFGVTEVARWFGIPPHKLRDLSRATFSNIAEQKLEWLEDLLPWLVHREQEIGYKLFNDVEKQRLYVEHNVDGLLKVDITKRYEAYTKGLQWGFLNRNEVRRKENWNSIGPEGDRYMTPGNMTDAADLGSQMEPAHAGGPQDATTTTGDLPVPDERSLQAAVDTLVSGLIAVESAEASKAATKPQNFVGWVDRFYERRLPDRMKPRIAPVAAACMAAGIEWDFAAALASHCEESRRQLIEASGETGVDGLPNRIADLIESWTSTRGKSWNLPPASSTRR